jgi:hypothetical protein
MKSRVNQIVGVARMMTKMSRLCLWMEGIAICIYFLKNFKLMEFVFS